MTKRINGSHFSKLCSSLTDPRISRRRLHSLESIVTITVCAVLCGVEFEESFYEWQKHLHDSLCGDVVAIDGKTLRGAEKPWTGKVSNL